ncbi:MAG TPA: ABC transporter ATP-binding protein [Ilumatobacter sp.]|nr:ABC transporter ATP-binding protein [Ilumatobacter sp.]
MDTVTDDAVVDVDGVSTTFTTQRGSVRAVHDVSLRIRAGEALGLVGESGSGKSVLARSVMGLLPAEATVTGSVRFHGDELVGRPAKDIRRLWGTGIAMVFQDPMTSLNPVHRIGAQVAEPLRRRLGMSRGEARREAIALLHSVGIPNPAERARQYPHEFSGGMRQRAMIAIALACGPSLLLADEPTTALDVTVQAQILDLLAAQQRRQQMAMMLVTHDLGVVATRTDRIAVMYAGRIVETAPTRSLFASMRMPYTEALFQSIPTLDDSRETRLRVIAGLPVDPTAALGGCAFAPRCAYATDRCRQEEPPLTSDGDPDHLFRCWYPIESSATGTIAPPSSPTKVEA